MLSLRSKFMSMQKALSSIEQVPRVTQVVSFDAMNTLIVPRERPPLTYSKFAKRHGIDVEPQPITAAFPKAMKNIAKKYPFFGHNTIGAQQWWTLVIREALEKALERELPEEETTKVCEELFHFFADEEAWQLVDPEAITVIAQLRQRGFGLAVVSNFDFRLRSLLNQLKLAHLFDIIVLSGELGIEKPDPKMFEIVVRHFDLHSTTELLHIGDDIRKDFLGARDVGAKSLLFDPLLKEDSISVNDKISRFNQISLY